MAKQNHSSQRIKLGKTLMSPSQPSRTTRTQTKFKKRTKNNRTMIWRSPRKPSRTSKFLRYRTTLLRIKEASLDKRRVYNQVFTGIDLYCNEPIGRKA